MQADSDVVNALNDDYKARYVDGNHVYCDHCPHLDFLYPDDAVIDTGTDVRTEGDSSYRNGNPLLIAASRAVCPAIPQRDLTNNEVVTVAALVVPTIVDAEPSGTDVQLTRSNFESQLLDILVAWCDRFSWRPILLSTKP